jgi:DNA polymerase-1
MIYLVTNRTEIPEFRSVDFIKRCTPEQSLEYLEKLDWIGFDSETGGFDYFIDPLYTIQLGNREHQFVIDTVSVDIKLYKPLLIEKGLIGHNLKFDLKFLYVNGIFPTKVYDTFLGEKTLSLGIDSHKCSLAACVLRYTGLVLSKEERANINGKLTTEFILYSAKDVEYLHEIKEIQLKKLEEVGSLVSIDLDNEFVKVLAYTEFCGMHLDQNMWKKKMLEVQHSLKIAEDTLNQFILNHNMQEFITTQLDLFSTGTKVIINWNSPQQVVQFFQRLGVDTKVVEKGEEKDTIEATHLGKFVSKVPIIKIYLDYKQAQKDLGTYGENWLNQIHPTTGRLHTQFKQLMNTGRLSSGGKNTKTKESYLNFQNIPSDEETRNCFTAPIGSLLIGCDYSSQENVVLANQSLDPDLLYFYDQGWSDMHSFIASKMFLELKGLSLKEIKENHKKRRQQSKVIGFCLAYGGSASALSDQLEISMEEAENMIKSYFEAFPQLAKYYEASKQFGLKNGYVLLSPVTGKRSYVNFYEEYLETTKEIQGDEDFWNKYKKHKESSTPTFAILKEKVSKWFRKKGDIERMSLNYKVQGESAEMTKLACVLFWRNYILPNKLINIVKVVNLVHDEILVECPEHIAEKTAKELQEAMEDAGTKFCKRVPLKADPCIDVKWTK